MERTRRGCLITLAKVYLAGGLLVMIPILGAYGVTWWQLRGEEEAWSNDLGASVLAGSFPPRAEPNETTRRAQALVEPLGIDLLAKRELTPEMRAVAAFVAAEERATADDDQPVPQPVRAVLQIHADRLTALETLLAGSDPPTWASDPDLFYREPAPPAEGPRALWALLLAQAIVEARSGRPERATLALAAAGRLQAGLQGRTQPIFQILAAGVSIARSGARRRVRADLGEGWDATGALRADFLASYGAEALLVVRHQQRHLVSLTDIALQEGEPPPTGLRADVERLATAPYLRWCATDHSRHVRRLVGALRASDPCHIDTDALDRRVMAGVSRWSTFARILLRTAATRWSLVAQAELEDELTRVIVDTRLRPPAEADVIASRVCRGLEWNRLPDGTGGVMIAAGGESRLPERGNRVPWRYHVRLPRGRP